MNQKPDDVLRDPKLRCLVEELRSHTADEVAAVLKALILEARSSDLNVADVQHNADTVREMSGWERRARYDVEMREALRHIVSNAVSPTGHTYSALDVLDGLLRHIDGLEAPEN